VQRPLICHGSKGGVGGCFMIPMGFWIEELRVPEQVQSFCVPISGISKISTARWLTHKKCKSHREVIGTHLIRLGTTVVLFSSCHKLTEHLVATQLHPQCASHLGILGLLADRVMAQAKLSA
jgi:hypothetical protein